MKPLKTAFHTFRVWGPGLGLQAVEGCHNPSSGGCLLEFGFVCRCLGKAGYLGREVISVRMCETLTVVVPLVLYVSQVRQCGFFRGGVAEPLSPPSPKPQALQTLNLSELS